MDANTAAAAAETAALEQVLLSASAETAAAVSALPAAQTVGYSLARAARGESGNALATLGAQAGASGGEGEYTESGSVRATPTTAVVSADPPAN
jgi:hypothetical protein